MIRDPDENRVHQPPLARGWQARLVEQKHSVREARTCHQRRDVVPAKPDVRGIRMTDRRFPGFQLNAPFRVLRVATILGPASRRRLRRRGVYRSHTVTITGRLTARCYPPHMTRLKKALHVTTAVCSVGAGALYAQARQGTATAVTPDTYAASKEWPTYGHDSGGMRFSPLTQITPANVTSLEVAWVYHLKPEGMAAPPAGGGRGGASGFRAAEVTPLVINGLMYISSPYGRVVALDAVTGKESWVYTLPSGNPASRGVEYFSGDETTSPQIVVGTSDAKLFTLDARTGALNLKFGENGFVNLNTPEITHGLPNGSAGVSSPPIM